MSFDKIITECLWLPWEVSVDRLSRESSFSCRFLGRTLRPLIVAAIDFHRYRRGASPVLRRVPRRVLEPSPIYRYVISRRHTSSLDTPIYNLLISSLNDLAFPTIIVPAFIATLSKLLGLYPHSTLLTEMYLRLCMCQCILRCTYNPKIYTDDYWFQPGDWIRMETMLNIAKHNECLNLSPAAGGNWLE